MKKKSLMIAAGLTMALGAGSAMISFGGANQIIRVEDGTRQVVEVENGQLVESFGGEGDVVAAEPDGTEGSIAADGNIQTQLQPIRMWGIITSVGEGSFTFDSQTENGYQGEVVVHIDPDQTLILDSVTGFPAGEDQIVSGNAVTVYVGPAMTMSLPPQTTAEMVFVNIPADGNIPLLVTAESDLADNGQGGYTLTSADGQTITVPADCAITPYLTRQMVTLQDLTQGRKCLVWLGADGAAERIVLFNA